MVFKLLESAQKSWRRLDGHNQLPKLVLGVKFNDGIKVIAKPTDRQPETAAALPARPSPKIGDSSRWHWTRLCYPPALCRSGQRLFLDQNLFGRTIMRVTYALCFLLAASSLPAAAAEQDLKQEVEKIASAYAESFNKQDAAGIAALYATGGVQVNQAGPTTDVAKRYEGVFKAGFNHNDLTVSQVSPLGNDAAVSMGEYHLTGKNQSGAPIEAAGIWTAVDVREGGTWKIRMLSAIPKPPQPAK